MLSSRVSVLRFVLFDCHSDCHILRSCFILSLRYFMYLHCIWFFSAVISSNIPSLLPWYVDWIKFEPQIRAHFETKRDQIIPPLGIFGGIKSGREGVHLSLTPLQENRHISITWCPTLPSLCSPVFSWSLSTSTHVV